MYLPSLSWWEDGSVNKQIMLVIDGWCVNVLDCCGLYEMVTQHQRQSAPHLVKRKQRLKRTSCGGTDAFIRFGCVIFQRPQKETRATPVNNFIKFIQWSGFFSVFMMCLWLIVELIYVMLKQCLWYVAWNNRKRYS